MSCYFIANIKIHDAARYEEYLRGFDDVFSSYDAEVVCVDDDPEVLEGGWMHSRVVLIRFRDREEAKRWYKSPGYQALVEHRHAASSANIILAEGRD